MSDPARSPGAPTLLILPTELERARLEALGGLGAGRALGALCGFGPLAAAARTAALLERLAPRRVVLLGIAGTYDPQRLAPGSASTFGAVALDGVGVGVGPDRLPPSALGLPQWPGGEGLEAGPVEERLALAAAPGARTGEGAATAPLLLTVCAASAGGDQAAERRARFPGVLAEDMEGFGAALACALAGVPLTVVRGISNRAGDRDRGTWCIDEALAAARTLTLELLEEGGR